MSQYTLYPSKKDIEEQIRICEQHRGAINVANIRGYASHTEQELFVASLQRLHGMKAQLILNLKNSAHYIHTTHLFAPIMMFQEFSDFEKQAITGAILVTPQVYNVVHYEPNQEIRNFLDAHRIEYEQRSVKDTFDPEYTPPADEDMME